MNDKKEEQGLSGNSDFAARAEGGSQGVVREMFDLLRHNKKLWMTPIILALLLFGLLVVLSSTAAAPFIYALF